MSRRTKQHKFYPTPTLTFQPSPRKIANGSTSQRRVPPLKQRFVFLLVALFVVGFYSICHTLILVSWNPSSSTAAGIHNNNHDNYIIHSFLSGIPDDQQSRYPKNQQSSSSTTNQGITKQGSQPHDETRRTYKNANHLDGVDINYDMDSKNNSIHENHGSSYHGRNASADDDDADDDNKNRNDENERKEDKSGAYNKSTSCLSLNSQNWLEKPRYSNIPRNLSHAEEFPQSGQDVLNFLPELLGHQSVCHEKSLFRNFKDGKQGQSSSLEESVLIQIWKIRLMYLSFYIHQHEHAMKEHQERKRLERIQGSDKCYEDIQKYNLNSFDYECRNAKLLLAEVRNTGIGSILKRDLFNIFMAGVVLNRTVVLYNAVERGVDGDPDYFWSYPWQLSSCPRNDYQCTFRPVTGCVPLVEDIFNATDVHHADIQTFLEGEYPYVVGQGRPPPEENTRIIRYKNPDKKVLNIRHRFLGRMNEIANSIIDDILETHEEHDNSLIPILRKAAKAILSDQDTRDFYKFDHEHSDAMISFIMYFLRPRVDKARQLDEFMRKDLPIDFDSSKTLGLPYRGSDKCNQESECLTFPTLMYLLKKRWFEMGFDEKFGHGENVTANILVTSEVPNIMELAYNFSVDDLYQRKLPFRPKWITNTNDIHQGNGSTKRPILSEGATADDIMMSILSSFKLQMNAAATVGNCCSNFHQTIFHLLRGGCGLHMENKGQCLQVRNESVYQLCCDFKYRKSCPSQRLERLRQEYNDEHITVQQVQDKLWE